MKLFSFFLLLISLLSIQFILLGCKSTPTGSDNDTPTGTSRYNPSGTSDSTHTGSDNPSGTSDDTPTGSDNDTPTTSITSDDSDSIDSENVSTVTDSPFVGSWEYDGKRFRIIDVGGTLLYRQIGYDESELIKIDNNKFELILNEKKIVIELDDYNKIKISSKDTVDEIEQFESFTYCDPSDIIPSKKPSSNIFETLEKVVWEDILRTQNPDFTWRPSVIYKAEDLISAIQKMINVGVGPQKLLGGTNSHDVKYALINIAAFLAQAMEETIQYDACDENNWDLSSGLTASNACGQLGQSYQDLTCEDDEEHMQCDVDPNMEIIATTKASWYGAPGPLFCAPKAAVPRAPKWNWGGWCDPNKYSTFVPFKSPSDLFDFIVDGGKCGIYKDQKAGYWEQCTAEGSVDSFLAPDPEGCPNIPAKKFGRDARTDVEGCCWWGRGVIQTSGICNYGKLNYYLGARAAREGRKALYPEVDFCRTPHHICTSGGKYSDLKWVSGLFFWMKEVQYYPTQNTYNFNYMDELKKFTNNGNINDDSFIDKVSGIVNRGCPHKLYCDAGPVHKPAKRAHSFRKVLKAFGFPWTDGCKTVQTSYRWAVPVTNTPSEIPVSVPDLYLKPVDKTSEKTIQHGNSTVIKIGDQVQAHGITADNMKKLIGKQGTVQEKKDGGKMFVVYFPEFANDDYNGKWNVFPKFLHKIGYAPLAFLENGMKVEVMKEIESLNKDEHDSYFKIPVGLVGVVQATDVTNDFLIKFEEMKKMLWFDKQYMPHLKNANSYAPLASLENGMKVEVMMELESLNKDAFGNNVKIPAGLVGEVKATDDAHDFLLEFQQMKKMLWFDKHNIAHLKNAK